MLSYHHTESEAGNEPSGRWLMVELVADRKAIGPREDIRDERQAKRQRKGCFYKLNNDDKTNNGIGRIPTGPGAERHGLIQHTGIAKNDPFSKLQSTRIFKE